MMQGRISSLPNGDASLRRYCASYDILHNLHNRQSATLAPLPAHHEDKQKHHHFDAQLAQQVHVVSSIPSPWLQPTTPIYKPPCEAPCLDALVPHTTAPSWAAASCRGRSCNHWYRGSMCPSLNLCYVNHGQKSMSVDSMEGIWDPS